MSECQPVRINAMLLSNEREDPGSCLTSAKRWGLIAGYILQGKSPRGNAIVIATVRARQNNGATNGPSYAIAETAAAITQKMEEALAMGAGELRLLIPFAQRRKAVLFLKLSSRRLRGKTGGLDYGISESEEVLHDLPEEQVPLMLRISQVRLTGALQK